MAQEGYDPRNSKVSEDLLADFLRAPITGDLSEVPGLGPNGVRLLGEGEGSDAVTTTHQLLGKFLSLKGADVGCVEHCDRMWYWLQSKGINTYRAGIVTAIAEKVNTMIPNIYDPSEFPDDE